MAMHMIISRVRHVQNPYQSCSSRDRHICSVETDSSVETTDAKVSCCYLYFGLIFVARVR